MIRGGIVLALVATLGAHTAGAQAPTSNEDGPADDAPPSPAPSTPAPNAPAPNAPWPGLVPGIPLVSGPLTPGLPRPIIGPPTQPPSAATPVEAPTESAAEACGTNRRCRLARLRERARQRRLDRAERVHMTQRRDEELRERARLSQVLREKAPFTMAPHVSDIRAGGIFGMHPHPNVWAGVLIGGAFNNNSFIRDAMQSVFVSLNTVAVIGVEVRWVMLTGPLSPYLSAGLDAMVGRASFVEQVFADGGSRSFGQASTEIHYVRGGLGLDLQLDFGLRVRAGFMLRPLIYTRFRRGGEPVQRARDAFVDGWSIIGGEGTIGWAL